MDADAFSEKVHTCQNQLYKVAYSIMGSHADAEDAVSEAVMRAWEKLGTLKSEEYFSTWLTRILINICRMELRSRQKHPYVPMDENLAAAPPPADTPVLDGILLQIGEKYRLPLTMHFVSGMSIADTAKALALPEGVVRWRLRKGKTLVAKALGGEDLL